MALPPPPQIPVTTSASGIHMNGGEGDDSYAKNSTPQRRVQQRLVPLVDAAVADLCRGATSAASPTWAGSSGPNTLFLVSAAVDATRRRFAAAGARGRSPEIRVFLNDLPDNDFNAVFRHLPAFLSSAKQTRTEPDADGNVLVFGAPGSFFGRLFPARSLHLVCSSFSLHWLSQIPQELAAGELVNIGNISAGRTSSALVIHAYARQFSRDLALFLEYRAVEVVAGGWVLVSLKGRSARDPCDEGCAMYDHPNSILNDMASRVITISFSQVPSMVVKDYGVTMVA